MCKTLFPLQKILAICALQQRFAIALTVVGTYGSLPLPSLATPIPAQSALWLDSKATPAEPTKPSLQLAQTPGQLANRSADNPFTNPPLLKDLGAPAPGKRVGGASRGRACPKASKSLTALVPIIPATSSESVLGLTFADHPTIWFYVPYSLTPAHPVEFILQDDKGTEVYKTLLSESGSGPGVVGFKLPDTVPPLEVNKRYKWFFTIYCDANERSDSRAVEGWVQRVAPDPSLQRELGQATPEQKAPLYMQKGVWYEAVTDLAELRRQKPNDATLKQKWDELMHLVDLDAIALEPITSMLTPKK